MRAFTPLTASLCRATFAAALMATVLGSTHPAWASIHGGEGNSPINHSGWPQGTSSVFDVKSRIAYWVGPPFGGGHWHAECRGGVAELNDVLAAFAKLDVKNRRIVVHDGIGHSFWLNPNRDPAKEREASIDWIFSVWEPESWDRLLRFPPDLRGPLNEPEKGPPAILDIYTGGNIRWEEVKIPEGLVVDDQRLAAHGFTLEDGIVLEGTLDSSDDAKPLVGRVELQRIETPQAVRSRSERATEGGYRFVPVMSVESNQQGKWVIKKAPAGRHRLVAKSEGYVSRVFGYGPTQDQPGWTGFHTTLTRATTLSGRITDEANRPIAQVDVRLADVSNGKDGRYESSDDYRTTTDMDGKFLLPNVPIGTARLWLHKPGYCLPGLGPTVKLPSEEVTFKMKESSQVEVTVKFTGMTRPQAYLVQIAPEEGAAVGRWSGSGNIDVKDQIRFRDVPPGRYVLYGSPNPGSESERSKAVTVELKGGSTTPVQLQAKQ